MSESYWIDTVPLQRRFPPLEGSRQTEFAVVGGGIAGLAAAYFLSKAGKKVILIEQNTLASGDTGYTTAFVSHFLDNIPATIKAWPAGEEALGLFQSIVEAESIDSEFRRVPSLAFSLSATALEKFKSDAAALEKLNPNIKFLDGPSASAECRFKVAAAISIPEEAQFHIRKFLLGLAEASVKKGAVFFEETGVLNVSADGRKVFTEKGEIECEKVLVTSGMALPNFPEVNSLLTSYFTYVIAADFPEPKPFGDYLFWDDAEPYHYFRWVSPSKVILGGEDRLMKGPRPAANPHENLKKFLEELTGRAAVLTHAWQGSIFMTKDSFPYYGAHPKYAENIVFATGFGGNGMTFGMLAGRALTDAALGQKNKFLEMFSFNR
ncbi:MAG: FAD-binding oxidoreductase [bacterium]|nr:FAD-binding oxidoreductase [bacterium]